MNEIKKHSIYSDLEIKEGELKKNIAFVVI